MYTIFYILTFFIIDIKIKNFNSSTHHDITISNELTYITYILDYKKL